MDSEDIPQCERRAAALFAGSQSRSLPAGCFQAPLWAFTTISSLVLTNAISCRYTSTNGFGRGVYTTDDHAPGSKRLLHGATLHGSYEAVGRENAYMALFSVDLAWNAWSPALSVYNVALNHYTMSTRHSDVQIVAGSTFDNLPYLIALECGQAIDNGATARIYKGTMHLGQTSFVVAVKVFGHILSNVQQELLVQELRAARQVSLSHRLILAFVGTADVGQQTAIVSLYMKNGNLMEYIKATWCCDKTKLVRQVAEAVNFLHTEKNLVHGDIKCANVLVSNFGDALLADFGLSTFIEKNQYELATMTAIRNMNTLRFAALELLTGPADPSMQPRSKTRESDVYAFGMLVLEAITENPPWHGSTDLAVMLRVSAGEHPPRLMNGPLVSTSHAVWELCLNCWKTDPREIIAMEDFLDVTRTSAFIIYPKRSIKNYRNTALFSIAYMPDSRHVVAGSCDGEIHIWDTRTGRAVVGPMRVHTSPLGSPASVLCVAVSPDGRQIVSGGRDDTIRRWDAKSGTPVGDPIPFVKMSHCITYSPDGNCFACGGGAGIRLWTASGGEVGKLQWSEGLVTALAFSPDSARIAVGTDMWVVKICDMATRVVLSTLRNCETVHSLAFSPDGTRLAIASLWSALRIWNFSKACVDLDIGEESTGTVYLLFSPEGNLLLGFHRGVGHIRDARTGQLIGSWPGVPAADCMSVSPDGRSMAACGRNANIVVWDMFA